MSLTIGQEIERAALKMHSFAYASGNAAEWNDPGERDWWIELAHIAIESWDPTV